MSITQLEKNVRDAQAALYSLRGKKFDHDAFTSAHDAILAAEAELAKAKSEPYAIPLDLGVETGREAPVMLSSPLATALVCEVFRRESEDGSRFDGYAVVEFPYSDWCTFGYPNDEAIEGHPMHGKGFDSYGAFEVFNSPWKKRMTEQNRIAFPDTKGSARRHFILSFHESTLECIAESVEITVTGSDFVSAFRVASEVVNRNTNRGITSR